MATKRRFRWNDKIYNWDISTSDKAYLKLNSEEDRERMYNAQREMIEKTGKLEDSWLAPPPHIRDREAVEITEGENIQVLKPDILANEGGVLFENPVPVGNADSKTGQIPVEKLVPYKDHQFKLYDGERLEDMTESIRQNGILIPVIVRPCHDGNYEILSGHNRVNAAKLAGISLIPAVIKDGLSEEEALNNVIETNLFQRSFSEMLPSEQAAVISLAHSKLFSQGKRNDIQKALNNMDSNEKINADFLDNNEENSTCSPEGNKLKSIEKIGIDYSLSKNTIARLLRINLLNKELKEMIDKQDLPIKAGVEISYLMPKVQQRLVTVIADDDISIDISKAKLLREKLSRNADENEIRAVLYKELNKNKKISKITIPYKKISSYIKPGLSQKETEDFIIEAIKVYTGLNQD